MIRVWVTMRVTDYPGLVTMRVTIRVRVPSGLGYAYGYDFDIVV